MNYFSLHLLSGEHFGFLIMLPDNEHEQPPQSGQFVLKLQSEEAVLDHKTIELLTPYEQASADLHWQLDKDKIALFSGDTLIGNIRQEFLSMAGQQFVLNDMTGMM